MNDKAILQLIAPHAGISATCWIDASHDWFQREGIGYNDEFDCQHLWNPITDNADAFNLLVTMQVRIDFHDNGVSAYVEGGSQGYFIDDAPDMHQATRRAIVLAVAEQCK